MRRSIAALSLVVVCAGCGTVIIGTGSGKDRRTPLDKAEAAGDLAAVQSLIAAGADPNDPNSAYGSPLVAAAGRLGNAAVIRTLVAAGANPNGRQPETGRCWASPLNFAASAGEGENVSALLEAGASIEQNACSQWIAGWLKPEIIELLTQHGLNLQAVDEKGRNELHLALAPPVTPPVDGIEYLIRSGVPLNARDQSGKTPLAYWREPRNFETHWLSTWLFERLGGDAEFHRQRDNRAKISALLAHSGATL